MHHFLRQLHLLLIYLHFTIIFFAFCTSMAPVEHNPDVLDLVDDDEDALSFRDFPIHEPESEAGDDDRPCRSPSYHDLFEFRTDLRQKTSSSPSPGEIVFCGKILDSVTLRDEDFASRGQNFRNSSESFMRNQSFRYGGASKSFSSPAVGGFECQRSNSRRPMALIGLVKTPSRMELSEIRKRQARLAPAPMFHVVPGEEPVTVAAKHTGGGISPWTLRYRSVLVRVLAKAASSCITHV